MSRATAISLATAIWRWCFPSLERPLLDRVLGFVGGDGGGTVNLGVCVAPAPTSFIWRWRQGPTSQLGWAPPIRARSKGGIWPLGQMPEITLTFSPLISIYTLSLITFAFTHSITD